MIMKAERVAFLTFLVSIAFIFIHPDAFCQQPPSLQEGINQYKEENYEEAIEALTRARDEDPKSSVAAFFLGLALKQVMEYPDALTHFRDAVTLTPRIKEALTELIDVALQLGKLDEAKKWIKVAEEEKISPAKIAFLKGLVLTKEGNNKEAVVSFELAQSLDDSISQACDVQIALCYLRERDLKKARDQFQKAIVKDPQSDLAGFARQYQDMVAQRILAERPFRFTVGVFGQYDTNMVLSPTNQSLAGIATDVESWVLNSSFRASYAPILKGPWLFSGQYAFSSSLHEKFRKTHDSLSNSFSISPGYNFGKVALNVITSYTRSLVRSPSYKEYLGTLSSGPLLRLAVKENHLLEFFSGYIWNDYVDPPLVPVDDRDSTDIDTYISWVWLFKKDAFFNLRLQYINSDADGINWDLRGKKVSVNLAIPLLETLQLQLSGQAFYEDYKNVNTHTTDGALKESNINREDHTYNFSGGFSWEFSKQGTFIVQYSKIRDDSNIGIYDYERELYTLGIEYRF